MDKNLDNLVLFMENIEKILNALEQGPMSFSDLKRKTGLENGVLQHYINNSELITRRNQAIMIRDQCSRCGLKSVCKEKCIHKILRDETKKRIANLIEGYSQAEISEKIGISRPSVNYHVQDLRENNVIDEGKIRDDVKQFL